MRKTLILLVALLSFFALFCCKYVPPSPPQYDDACTPSHSHYLNIASATTQLDKVGAVPTDPELAYAYCVDLVETRGWKFVRLPGGDATDEDALWGSFGTTLPSEIPVIPLPADFDSRSFEEKALFACHEVVHTFQWENYGTAHFLLSYVLAEGTWAFETQAYRMSFRVWLGFHPEATPEEKQAVARAYAGKVFGPPYNVTKMPSQCGIETGIEILLREAA